MFLLSIKSATIQNLQNKWGSYPKSITKKHYEKT